MVPVDSTTGSGSTCTASPSAPASSSALLALKNRPPPASAMHCNCAVSVSPRSKPTTCSLKSTPDCLAALTASHGSPPPDSSPSETSTTLADCSDCRSCSRSEEHTSELQSLMRISYAVFCLKKKNRKATTQRIN